MSSWNYRIIIDPDGTVGAHIVFYDDSRQPTSWSENPVDLGGFEDVADVIHEISLLSHDAQRPPLRLTGERMLVEVES